MTDHDRPLMRLELAPVAVELAAAETPPAGDGAIPPPPRTVAGLAVPYEIEARVGWRWVTFAAGSITFPDASPLLLGHDPDRPVGVLTGSEQSDAGARAAWAVDATADGDAALVQARSGSRRGLSVGVDVQALEYPDPADEERIRVTAGVAVETSLVSLAAFTNAGVDQVAAGQTREAATMPDGAQTIEAPAPASQIAAGDLERITEAVAARLEADDRRPRLVVDEPDRPTMRLGEYCACWIRARRGDTSARERLEAALTREVLSDNQGVVPIAYVTQIVDSLAAPRTLFDALTKAEMPPAGMLIRRPQITTRPDGQWLADDTAGMPTGPLQIGQMDTQIKQWAWGGSASVALVERSMPSYVEEAFAQMLKAYYRDVETDLAAFFPGAALTTPVTTIGGAVAAYTAAYHQAPGLIVAGGDAYGKLMDSIGLLRFASGTLEADGDTATLYGLPLVLSADVAAGNVWVTDRDLVESRESSPLRLTVADVGGLSFEIGLTAFFAATQTRQSVGEIAGAVPIVGYTPALATGAEPTSGGRSRQ